MRTSLSTALLLVTLCSLAFSETRWRTTRNGRSEGTCAIEALNYQVEIHDHYVNVIEEAIIRTEKDNSSLRWWTGDSTTLEITGDFRFSPGTALRSMLLWFNDDILKAKLKQRDVANEEYEEVVNREVVRDPALIEYLGDGKYSYKIFPVELNKSRKIRILYTVPLMETDEGPGFQIQPAFLRGTESYPSFVPIRITAGSHTEKTYMMKYGDVNKPVRFGSNYQIPADAFLTYDSRSGIYDGLFFIEKDGMPSSAYTALVDDGLRSGNYTGVYCRLPENTGVIPDILPTGYNVELQITVDSAYYLYDIDPGTNNSCSFYIKSKGPWNNTLTWNVYGPQGDQQWTYTETIATETLTENPEMLGLLWAAKYSLDQEKGSLGAFYGFVDREMSLLALEEDMLPVAVAEQYQQWGMPVLDLEDIFVQNNKYPKTPDQDIYMETGFMSTDRDVLAIPFSVAIYQNTIQLNLDAFLESEGTVLLLDMKGRVIARWNLSQGYHTITRLTLNTPCQGQYVLHVKYNGIQISRTVSLH